jgi:hypothetical protein
MPAGPAPTTRTDVLDGKDWDIVGKVLARSGERNYWMFKYIGRWARLAIVQLEQDGW